jgi:hypothetical protein
VEAASEEIAKAAIRHAIQGALDHRAQRGLRRVAPAVQQEGQRGGMGELGLPAEPAVDPIRGGENAVTGIGDRGRAQGPRGGLVEVPGECVPKHPGLLGYPGSVASPDLVHPLQNLAEGRAAVGRLRGEIGAPEEEFGLRRQESGERPSTLPGDRLHRPLIPGVHLRPLVPVHLHADEPGVQELGERGILIGLLVHHVAPVTPDRADVEQHRPVGFPGQREGLAAPGMPPDRLMRRGAEICRGRRAQTIAAHAAQS